MKHVVAAAAAIGLVGSLAAAQPASAADQPSGPLDAKNAEAVEAVVRQFILDNPEVIIESMQNYQVRQQLAEQQAAAAAMTTHADELKNDPTSPVAGNPKGDVTIVEFFDYRCGYCKKVFPTVRELLKTDKNVRYVFKEFPILGPDSVTASHAALAVWSLAPDKYLDFHAALMDARGSLGEEQVLAIAKKVGLDPDKVRKAMADPKIKQSIERNIALAQSLSIQGTPAFIVGDELLPGAIDLDHLRELVAAQRAS